MSRPVPANRKLVLTPRPTKRSRVCAAVGARDRPIVVNMTEAEDRPLYRLLRDFALFNHNPQIVADETNLPHASCNCGWRTLPIPSPFQFAVWDALAWHQCEVNVAIDTWRVFRDVRARMFADDVEAWMREGWAHGNSNPEPAG